jgi:hypothetical protein
MNVPPPAPGTSPLLVSPFILAVSLPDAGVEVAIAVAARYVERLALVIVSGDIEVARQLLDDAGRSDVAVARAPGLAAVRSITSAYPYHIRWANHGPLSALDAALSADPALADRLAVTVSLPDAGVLARLRTPSPALHEPAVAWRAPYPPTLVMAPSAPSLVIAAAMLRPFVRFEDAVAPSGQPVQLATPVRDDALADWVRRVLSS